ncbi:phage tail spike protein [Limosilactobacillus vaginalis]|uniref:phage tail spike protein n=1 Tax=Limosilactobacillus vaginalis TaxID=1633 RepID=UPI0024326B4A|nr:phage tail spike protein [Limosilactobacillus vaginalis]
MKMFLLNHQQRVKKWLTDKNFIEATLTEQINAADELKFSLPLKARLPASFYFAVIPRPRHDDYLMFKIIQEQVQNDRIQYTCVEAAYDELKSYNYIKDIRPRDRTASNMLQIALQGTRWNVGQVSDGGTSSTNFYYVNTLEAIQKIVNLFNLEAVFSVSLDKHNARVVRRRVNLYSQQGERTGKRFEYGSNLLTVEREENSENLVTALIGRGKGEEIYHDADGNKTTAPASNANDAPDGYGRRINFADVVWSKSAGNPVDKPAGQEYVEDPNATAVYGFDDGKPRIGLEIFEDITDPNELLQATWKSLQVLKRPKVSFKASVMDVGNLGLGDTVAIIRHDIQIEYFTRVYKVTHNLLDEKQNTIELGDDFSSHSMTSTIASMSGAIEKVKETAGYAATSANGKNTNFYSQDKPAYATEGDLWYKDLGNGETDLYQYHDGNWILISSTRELNQAKKEIDQQLDNLKQLEKNKGIDIDEIKKDMKSVEDTANQAFKNGETNRTDLDKLDGEITGRITEVLTNGGYATQSWTQGQFKLNKSSFDVQIANVLKTTNSNSGKIDSLNGSINGMNKTIDGINTNVGSNATKIAQLIVDLKGIQSTVASKADISQVNQKADEWSVKVEGLDRKLEQRTGVNPNMLNGTADWSGDWDEDQADYNGFIPQTVMNWDKDGWTDPEGNAALVQPKSTPSNSPQKLIYLTSGTYTLSSWVYLKDNADNKGCLSAQKPILADVKEKAEIEKISSVDANLLNQWQRISLTFKVTKAGVLKVFLFTHKATTDTNQTHFGSLKLEKGNKATAWVPSANDPYKGTGESLSMINVDAGNILFKSKKIYLDADSTVFSGKAFIPDAAISNLSADKITTGTLNAGNINVINLNANSITTGTISGTNLKINLKSGEILFQHGRITSAANTLNIDIDQGTMSVTDSTGAGVYFANGELVLNDGPINSWFFTGKYGGIRRGFQSWTTGVNGMEIHSPNGVALNTDNYNGAFSGGTGLDQTVAGAGIGIDNNGTISVNGAGVVSISGGNQYDVGTFGWKERPHIWVGSNVNYGVGSRIVIDADYVHIPAVYNKTASSGSWVMVAPDGALIRSTSASKYKTDIKRSYVFDYGDRLLNLPTATWMDKAEMKRYANGESKEKPTRNFGMIAEDLANAGLEMLVLRNPEGGLEGIQYDRIGVALIPVVKHLKDKVEKLEEKLNEQQ